jgi:hypothetical protein
MPGGHRLDLAKCPLLTQTDIYRYVRPFNKHGVIENSVWDVLHAGPNTRITLSVGDDRVTDGLLRRLLPN